jgi:hypothetical protein
VLSLRVERSGFDEVSNATQPRSKESGMDVEGTDNVRRSRLSPTGETLALCGLIANNDADAGQPEGLEPPAGNSHCSSCVLRGPIVAAIGTRTAYSLDVDSMRTKLLECQ